MSVNQKPLVVNNEKEFRQILQSMDKFIALVYASWCPFCIRFLPVFEKHAGEPSVPGVVVKDDREIIADTYGVDVVPTILVFENGQVVKRLNGRLGFGLSESQLLEFISDIK